MKLGILLNASEVAAEQKATLDHAKNSIYLGIQEATNAGKQGLRDMTKAAFKGNKLPNTWRSEMYGRGSFHPAGLLHTRAPEIMQAWSQSTVLHNNHGRFLAIPTELVGRIGNRRLRPEDYDDSQSPLRFVPLPNGHAMLVVDNIRVTSRGRLRLASDRAKAQGRTATAIMFNLIPEVTLEPRINPGPIVKAAGETVPERIVKHLEERGK
jgi:hypothetical protein